MKRARFPGGMERRKSSIPHYHTFPTPPPKSRGRPPISPTSSSARDGSTNPQSNGGENDPDHRNSPLPVKQLAILAVIALAEQTALNSISPYLPEMTSKFPEVDPSQIGLYVGTIASSFALAQFATNFFWGWLSDRIGRKPVVMLGTLLTAACFVAFGFCRTLWQAVLVQALMGLVNGNQGVISTCLGEITDRTNQSQAFVWLPVIYGIGGITGPAVGGLLVLEDNPFKKGTPNPYPYLLPNLFSALVLIIDLVLTGFFLEESLEEAKDLPPLKHRIGNLFAYLWQFIGGARKPTYTRPHSRGTGLDDSDADDDASENSSLLSMSEFFHSSNQAQLTYKEILNRDTILLLSTYLIFQLSNISFNSLYPIFASAPSPSGRELSPSEIGLSLSFAGIVTIVFQVCIFGRLRDRMGNKATYRAGLFLFFISMMAMPWVGYKDSSPPLGIGSGKLWIWIEIGGVLLIKTVAAVGGLTSALLLITNSAPNHGVLGTLNGLAQTLSAAGRAVGPFVSGGLFSLGTRVGSGNGELLAWGVFGGVAFVGFLGSWGIRGEQLESEEWSDEEEGDEESGSGSGSASGSGSEGEGRR
ncbi:mfs transporter protein [Rutstroemia sp. NJR-2017a BVV2]|nr:mfs transporter protein [Rutstroemia sp. NJR-2017a BVV2]